MILKNRLQSKINKGYQAQNCTLCHSKFSLLKLNRIHKCKRCKRFICKNCGKNKTLVLYQKGYDKVSHRVCYQCQQDIQSIHQTILKVNIIQEYDIQWNKNSKLTQTWNCSIQPYNHYLQLFYKNRASYSQSQQIIHKDVILGRTDWNVFNSSYRKYLTLNKDVTKQQARVSIAKVLYALVVKYPFIGYCQGMSIIAAFLVSIAQQQYAFSLFCCLFEKILPSKLYEKSDHGASLIGLLAQLHFMSNSYKQNYKIKNKQQIDQQSFLTIKSYMDLLGTKFFLTMMLGNLSFSNIFFVWSEVFKQKTFEPIDKAFLAIVSIISQYFSTLSYNIQQFEHRIETLDHQVFVLQYRETKCDSELRKSSYEEYMNNFSLKWTDSSKYTLQKLANISKFTTKQLQIIQKGFMQFINLNNNKGLNEKQFIQLLKFCSITIQSNNKSKFLKQDTFYCNLFRLFDQEINKFLDFREFICIMTIILKGTIKQKFELLFRTYTLQKKLLNKKQLDDLLELIFNTVRMSIQQTQQIVLLQEQFRKRLKEQFQGQKVSISQLYLITEDQFIAQLCLQKKKKSSQIGVQKICQFFQRKISLKQM